MSAVLIKNKVMKMGKHLALLAVTIMSICIFPAWAETNDMKEMDHSQMPSMSHSGTHDMSQDSMQGGAAPENARDPHAFSDGYDFGSIPRLRLADEHSFGSLLIDRLESARTPDNTVMVYDLQAWYGRDYDRAVFKFEGETVKNKVEDSSAEVLWGHAVSAYWNTQLGVRYDSGEGPNRSWLAFGFQGLAPYWFEVDATLYMGEEGRSALSLESEYEILFTQKLILQPRIEAEIYGKDDVERGIGSGLSEIAAGLRLRYEFFREFAPYLGIEWESKYGESANIARSAGLDTRETRVVAGLRFWY